MKTPEQKVAEQLTNLTEDHWFNAASLARYLTDQPYYTTDRIMELVAQIIKWGGRRHEDELTPSGVYESNTSSEGLFLANELSKYLDELKQTYVWEYLKAQGITVGVRGRFSGAAKIVIAEAVAKGVTFTEEKTAKAK